MDANILFDKARSYLPEDKITLVQAAYNFAQKAHQGQLRKSGEPYMDHPVSTAMILANQQLDATTLAAALLHDVTEDCGISLDEIEKLFGQEVRKLVDGITKLSKIAWHGGPKDSTSGVKSQAENLRKMLLAMAEDLRVVFIKLADRLHNMQTLGALAPEKRRAIARETLEIYAPLAHRLGIWEAKWQLEDLSFRYLEPQQYHKIARLVATRRKARESFITEIIESLRQEFEKVNIKADIFGRPKHIYSIYTKINRYAAQGKSFSDIHDLFALRVLVDTVSDCYKALGTIHNLWHPIPEEFNDYIANPKFNGYQSLHTTVLSSSGTPLEIQIRTYEMHRSADYGIASHWRYKEAAKEDINFDDKVAWLRQLIEWQSELGSEEFLESLKTDVFIDQVFIFSPKGDILPLPRGATPLDFAYRIHTEVGHRCIGAKVNGKLMSLNHKLKNGDIVEIMTTKTGRGPSLDWLNSDLGYVQTSHAREKIKQWFKKQEKTQNVERGRQLLERELKRIGATPMNSDEMAQLFNYDTYEDFLAAFGSGNVTPHQLMVKLVEEPEPPPLTTKIAPSTEKKLTSSGVQVLGVGDLLTHLAGCCNPLPGDDIIGYITRSEGITIHRKDCMNIVNEQEKERLVKTSWGPVVEVYPIKIRIDVWNRVGVLRDITTVIAEEKINISSISTTEQEDVTSVHVTLEIKNMAQLTHLLSKIQSVRGVINAVRYSKIKTGI